MRNKEKFAYIEVAIPLESALYRLLSADAEGASQSLAQIMLVRLADFYRGSQPGTLPQAPRPAIPQVEALAQESRGPREAPLALDAEQQEEEELPEFDLSKALASADLFDQFS